MNSALNNIMSRRSIRSFKPEQITDDELSVILDAGRAAPSSMNRQPWHFTVIQNSALLDQMVSDNRQIVKASPELSALSPWANGPEMHNFYNAPTVILFSGETANPWHVCDCAIAMENMALAAHSISLGTCIVASARYIFLGEKAAEYIERLGIPEGYKPLFALSVGYPLGDNPKATPRKSGCVNYIR